jgi:hypothetical protein
VKIGFSSRTKWFVLAAAVLLLIVALTWQSIMFGVAFAFAEKRPTLLRDANWDTPVLAFNQRFSAGTPETELLQWLSDNEFTDVRKGRASRTIDGLPCQEQVEVSWTTVDGVISESNAIVSEAGCL